MKYLWVIALALLFSGCTSSEKPSGCNWVDGRDGSKELRCGE